MRVAWWSDWYCPLAISAVWQEGEASIDGSKKYPLLLDAPGTCTCLEK
jgi:hypothetical protein